MPSVTDHPDDFDREWAYRRGYRTVRIVISKAPKPEPKDAPVAEERAAI